MASLKKISLSQSRDIPFNKLLLSNRNVRRVQAGLSIEALAEDIAQRTLLQSLSVRLLPDREGFYAVQAGGRRYRALELLVRQKRLASNAPIPCIIREEGLIEEDSLAENVQRLNLHPLDQFRAFQALRDQGLSEEEIAARFFVTPQMVKQRIRLASVSPKLLEIYAADDMTLEQLMAFTVSVDHIRQEQVWEAIQGGWQKEPFQIRRRLTESVVRASDKRVQFVGVEAYEAAGGGVLRDLFESDDGGWLQEPALLDRLVAEKLKAAADEIAKEGWKWVETAISFPYEIVRGLRKIPGAPLDLTADQQAKTEALGAEYERLEVEYQDADELPEAVIQRFEEIETALADFDDRPMRYDPAEIALAGVFITIGDNGALSIDRGYIRPEDETPVENDGQTEPRAVTPPDNQPTEAAETEEPEEDGIKPLPERLVAELTAYRTLALQDAVARNPPVAMTALLHKLVSDSFRHCGTGALEARVEPVSFPAQDSGLKDSPSALSIAERHQAWSRDIPDDDATLWHWLDQLDAASRMALLAHCVSFGVNALQQRPNPHSASSISQYGLDQRLAQADRLARVTGLNLVEAGWRPTIDNYLGRVTKTRILQAVREGAGEHSGQLIDHLKKDDMAREAERLLVDTGWLPEPLRLADVNDDGATDIAVDQDDGDQSSLPAFLTDDGGDDDSVTAEDDGKIMVAAR